MPLLTPDESVARVKARSSETDARVIDAWQYLSERTQATILAILDAAGDAPSDA